MIIFLYPFLALSALGLALSVAVHLAALLGLHVPSEALNLHLGLFVVWIPTILLSNFTRHGFRRHYGWKDSLRGCPLWLQWMVYGLFAYAFANMLLMFFNGLAAETIAPLRVFSGHWMAFYGAAFGVLYSTVHLTPSVQDLAEKPLPLNLVNQATSRSPKN